MSTVDAYFSKLLIPSYFWTCICTSWWDKSRFKFFEIFWTLDFGHFTLWLSLYISLYDKFNSTFNNKIVRKIKIYGQRLDGVNGIQNYEECRAIDGIKSGLQKTKTAFLSLSQVYGNPASTVSVKTKVKIYTSNMRSVLDDDSGRHQDVWNTQEHNYA